MSSWVDRVSGSRARRLRRASSGAVRALFESLEDRQLLSGTLVRPDHIVVVIEEDRASDAIGDVAHMPYFNQLAASGLVYTNSHGVAHPSLPDYLALYSGSTQGITDNGNNHTFTGTNLAKVLNSTLVGPGQYLSFGGFAESLPRDGDTTTRIAGDPNDPSAPPDLYMRNYNPMAQFTDVGSRGGVALTNAQVNKTFASFPTTAAGFDALPTVSFVIPNSLHNTHGSNEQAPYATDPSEYNFLRSNADTWLKATMDAYLQWAKSHNSLLIITTDEEETDSSPTEGITTIVNGDARLVVPGTNDTLVNHFNLLRTIEDMYGLTPLGSTATAAPLTTNALGQLSYPGQVTDQSDSLTTLASGAPAAVWGQGVTFTANVAPLPGASGVPTGSVTFMDGATMLGAASLDGTGRATLSVSTLSVGSHSISAIYGGDAAFRTSTSSAVTQTINRATSAVTVTAPATVGQGRAVTFSARVSAVAPGAGTAGGTIQFQIDGVNFGAPVTLAGGVATGAAINSLTLGSHTVTAIYAGDANFLDATGSAVTQVAPLAGSATGLSVSPSPSVFGQSVQLAATVAATASGSTTPTGSVTFMDGSTAIGTAALNAAGVATLNTAALTVGTHQLTAVYGGDAAFAGSASAAVAHVVAQLSNDKFANRIALAGAAVTTTGTNVGATKETGEPKHAGNAGGKSVWWTWTAPSAGTVTIDTAGSNFDTLLAVYTGTSVSALTAVSGGNNDNASTGVVTSKVTFTVTAGKVYQIAVDGKNGASGAITLHLNLIPPAPAAPTGVAASDGLFTDRVRVTWNAVASATAYEVWRNTTNSTSSAVKISPAVDVTGTTFDDLTAVQGTTYYYWVKAKNAGGTSGLGASNSGYKALTGPTNDNFVNRTVLTGASLTATASSLRATKEAGEPNHAGNAGGKSVWFTWTAPTSGTVTIDTAGSNFDTLLAVYTGTSVSALTAVASNDDSLSGGTTTSKVTFQVTAGTVYQIAVDGYDGVWGNITLHLNLV